MEATKDYQPVATTSVELTNIDSNNDHVSIVVKTEKSSEQIKFERKLSETKLGLGTDDFHLSESIYTKRFFISHKFLSPS